ncbi:MAG: hypothetical protein ISS36_01285 [Candidatus Aenigmarchaeota archaeon]|nr:hypothetical protein [Candidatus Aenigmarchaeota archaeon]
MKEQHKIRARNIGEVWVWFMRTRGALGGVALREVRFKVLDVKGGNVDCLFDNGERGTVRIHKLMEPEVVTF